MSWPKVVGGAAVGAYALKQAEDTGAGQTLRSLAKTVTGLDLGASSSGRGSGETSVLQGEVERLHRLLENQMKRGGSSGYTVIHTGRSGWTYVVVPLAVAGGVTYVYCRVTGKSVWDLFFVTNRSLAEFRHSVTESIKVVWDEIKRQKDEVLAKVGLLGTQQERLSAQQEALLKHQEEMDARMREMGHDVIDVRFTADAIKDDLGQLRDDHSKMHDTVNLATTGIMALCSAVASVTRHVGLQDSETLRALESMSSGTAGKRLSGAADGAQGESGLKMLLGNGAADGAAASRAGRSASVPPTSMPGAGGYRGTTSLSSAATVGPSGAYTSISEEGESMPLPPLLASTGDVGKSSLNGRGSGFLSGLKSLGSGRV